MRPAERIIEGVRRGEIRNGDAQVELLLDIRALLEKQVEHLEVLAARWRKPGRPRKKKTASPYDPAGRARARRGG